MFVFLIERKGNIHIIDYKSTRGSYRTVCDRIIHTSALVNTLASDASIPAMCSKCHRIYDEMYLGDLDFNPRMARSNIQINLLKTMEWHKDGILGPQTQYSYSLEIKPNRYRKFLRRNSKYYGK